MSIIIDSSELTEQPVWPDERIREVVSFALAQMEVPADAEVSVSLVDTARIHELNRTFRGVDRLTDVLSFPCDELDDEEVEAGEPLVLGDIVIAPAVCAEQAPTYGNSFDEEMTMLAVHSVLHLLGYDHIEDADAAEMQAEERRIITAWREGQGMPRRDDVLGYQDAADRRHA